jgi:hypothetical protein
MQIQTKTGETGSLTPANVQKLLGQHKQMRNCSCFQSTPEMWLKLNGVIGWGDYPEQSQEHNDEKGYEPYPNDGPKIYAGTAVQFLQQTFQAPYEKLFDRLSAEIADGRFVVVSLRPPWGGWHGYLVTHKVDDDFIVFTKRGLNEGDTEEDRLKARLVTNEKVDCLFIQVAKQKPAPISAADGGDRQLG